MLVRDVMTVDPITFRPVTAPQTVEDVYTRSAVAVRPDDDVASAVEVMSDKGFKSLPVVDDGHLLVGILSRSDVVRALARPDHRPDRPGGCRGAGPLTFARRVVSG